jgi:adenine-specific DNA-methyltransferase
MSQKYDKLKVLLEELFQLDQPDLDFGLYRIMHAKSAEVSQFLDRDLLPQVKEAFALYKNADKTEIEKELAKAIEQAHGLGVDPETTQRVKDLRARLTNEVVDVGQLESEVYDHLFSFFRRYYSEGDFLSKRVYKPGVYAIPYEGEEVKLHWANADQYYIKTSEYLRDYTFRLRPDDATNPMRVHFRLVDAAEGEHGNVKASAGKDRRFKLVESNALAIADGELIVRFTYEPDGSKQKELNAAAEKELLTSNEAAFGDWIAELRAKHRRSDGTHSDNTRLRVHLDRYTARNTFDYFIHKDLAAFLRRELDFYVKNEVMHLDDIENEHAPRVEQYLSKIKVIRRIAGKIIDFLAQLENFQKKLWLKKKFVVETLWCIRLGVIPEEFYPEISANEAQHKEWVKLYAIDEVDGDLTTPRYTNPLTAEFLKANPTLMVDTQHFGGEFTARLLGANSDIDEQLDGVLFYSENFQALSLMQSRYKEQVQCVYADPPYNTSATEIIYKNSYKHSSWMSFVGDRLQLAYSVIAPGGSLCVTIDDFEFHRLRTLLEDAFSADSLLGIAAIKNNPSGRATAQGFSIAHEYALFVGKGIDAKVGRLPHSEEQRSRYKEIDAEGQFEWVNFRKHGGANANRYARPKLFYAIFVSESAVRIPEQEWDESARRWRLLEEPTIGETIVYPTTPGGDEKTWKWGIETALRQMAALKPGRDQSGRLAVYRKARFQEQGTLPRTIWDKSEYSSTEYGTNLLADIFGEKEVFAFPKSIHAVTDCLRVGNVNEQDYVVDFFAGSGTTGHAVINLNRDDDGRRRFVLLESGMHFVTALLPRLKKVTFSPEWKDGKPKRLATAEEAERSPRIIKVVRLESYEDALNNLETSRTTTQEQLLLAPEAQGPDGLKEQYILRYLLDVETRGSQSLLNVQGFTDPTAYTLKVKCPRFDEAREVNVDLLETFNWLIGLSVKHFSAPQTFSAAFERDSEGRLRVKGRLKQEADGVFWFRTVTGTTPDRRRALVIWRKLTGNPEEDNLVLDEWFTKQGYSAKDSEFDLIYVNGGNNLENLKTADDLWKVRLIEEDFHRLMFEMDGA